VDAHAEYERRPLRQWVAEADAVVLAQFATGLQVSRAADGADSQRFFRIRVIESLRGSLAGDLEFFARADEEPRWRPGDVALLFFDRTADHAELSHLAHRFPYFSFQGAGYEWTLAPATRDDVVSIARGWVTAPPTLPAEDLRTVLLRELRSGDQRLQSDALAELAHSGCAAQLFPDAAALDPFATLVTAGSLLAPNRMALVHALDGCPGFDTAAALRQLADQPLPPRERTALIRSAALIREAPYGEWLVSMLNDPDPLIRQEAIAALGHPWHTVGIAPLANAAATGSDTVATAAVRALAAAGTPAAAAALAELAHSQRVLVANTARAYLKQMPTPARQP
jgi:hypothetical protein